MKWGVNSPSFSLPQKTSCTLSMQAYNKVIENKAFAIEMEAAMRTKSIELMKKIKEYTERYYLNHGQSPTTSQISTALQIGRTTAYSYLVEMDRRGMISYDGKNIRTSVIERSCPSMIRAAVLGDIACGLPNFAEENVEEYVSLPESMFGQGEFYILRARGESMIDAGIAPRDLVVIRKTPIANQGDIVVAIVGDEATLKRYYRDDAHRRRIVLHPENQEMDDIYVDHCAIQGVVVKVIKDL